VLIPSENKLLTVLRNERIEFSQFGSTKTTRLDQSDRLQPKLRVPFGLLYMDMAWLVVFSTEEEETKAADPQNLWHGGNLRQTLYVVIHRELVGVRPETQGIVFLLFHLDPVRDEVGVKDVAFEEEVVVLGQRFDRTAE
jgi:hypothetical protein